MLDGLVLSFKIPQRQLGDLEVFWGGYWAYAHKNEFGIVQSKR